MTVRFFGKTGMDEAVGAVRICGGGLSADIISFGASLRDLRLDGVDRPLILGLDNAQDYCRHSPHFGAIAGRFANRIAGGEAPIDGVVHRFSRNDGGINTLHGGADGFGKRVWRIDAWGADFVRLSLLSRGGDQGFPGTLRARCEYRLPGSGVLAVNLSATCDAATLVNLAPHAYFNLDGSGQIDGHVLEIDAASHTAVDERLIPTGDVVDLAGTRYDFRQPRPIGDGAFDDNFCLADAARPTPRCAARVAAGGVAMSVETDQPGLQFYTADKLAVPVAGLEGRRYHARAGLCLEPQVWPDAPNHRDFPSALLRPGDVYEHATRYCFEAASG